jgi:hypothetical protein
MGPATPVIVLARSADDRDDGCDEERERVNVLARSADDRDESNMIYEVLAACCLLGQLTTETTVPD